MFNVLYDTFKKLADDPQEPIDLAPLPDLLKNEIEMISQTRYFSPQQVDIIVTRAVNEARLLLLPPLEVVSLEELEHAWRVRGNVLIVLDDPSMQELLANRLLPNIPNRRKLYDSIVFLNRELRFARECFGEITKRIQSSPVARNTLGLVMDPKDSDYLRQKQAEAYSELQRMSCRIARNVGRQIEDGEDALHDWTTKLHSMPFHQKIQRLGATYKAIHDSLIDQQRRADRHEHISLDDMKTPDGHQTTRPGELESKYKSLQTQPQEKLPKDIDVYLELVGDIREAHGDTVAEIAEVYFEIYFQKDKKVKQQQIAQKLGINRRTVYRAIEEIEKFCASRGFELRKKN